ncbi:D-2-hydroxyacid dehydrogenase [Bosea sp. PAMC 26642]|uniref:D-2-hydroxyacid dehydrogenase n=1 Tax=Bosea sp. (strain PAMC 26642) TaxID=1792307 RepID=UPI00076FF3AE|nr:D-2-hydroxyacid dehydrogenase [Bosea sp. PAMC 26642]AMJ62635.1 hydroxyacid dehydrogenase [Bosea sp. PAMC 26642]
MPTLPRDSELTIGFAHAAYQLQDEFLTRGSAAKSVEMRSLDELKARAAELDVLVVSGLWRNELIAAAPKLRFVQSVSAGTDQFDKPAFSAAGIRLASAQGANERAVSEHAMALILTLTRQIHLARDNQTTRHWRPMIGDRSIREDELGGKTLVIVGLGRIGLRLAALAGAFGLRVIGVRRQPEPVAGIEAIVRPDQLHEVIAQADIVALTCPLTPETEGLIDARALAAMKPSAVLINVARGKVVDETALLAALTDGRIAGAGLDTFHDEPLPPASPFWALPQVVVTPHSAGETQRYEANVVDLLLENLGRLGRGETSLRNQIV